eukprot:Skav235870  [mRNA]  locus=C8774286:95:460:+ [translate_table: standard]
MVHGLGMRMLVKSSPLKALELVRAVAPSKDRCPSCSSWVASNHKYCPYCRSENENFDESQFQIHRAGRRSGWRKNESAVEEALDEKTLTAVTDLMSELRRRNRNSSSAAAPTAEEMMVCLA